MVVKNSFLKSIHLSRGIASILVAWIHAVQFFPGEFDSVLFQEKSNIVFVGRENSRTCPCLKASWLVRHSIFQYG